MGAIFLNVNRNKRSIVLDLKKPAALEACLALAKQADVLVYNIRPQAMARLGLSYEKVRSINEKIIYVGCFGYSQRGPYAAKAAYDDMIQGASGLPWLLQKQGAAEPRYAPMIIAAVMGSKLSESELMQLLIGAAVVDIIFAVIMTCFHTLLIFAFPLIVDRNLGAWQAIKTSASAVLKNISGIVGMLGVTIIASIPVSLLTCELGAYLLLPVMFAGYALAYRKIFPKTERNMYPPPPNAYR